MCQCWFTNEYGRLTLACTYFCKCECHQGDDKEIDAIFAAASDSINLDNVVDLAEYRDRKNAKVKLLL